MRRKEVEYFSYTLGRPILHTHAKQTHFKEGDRNLSELRKHFGEDFPNKTTISVFGGEAQMTVDMGAFTNWCVRHGMRSGETYKEFLTSHYDNDALRVLRPYVRFQL